MNIYAIEFTLEINTYRYEVGIDGVIDLSICLDEDFCELRVIYSESMEEYLNFTPLSMSITVKNN